MFERVQGFAVFGVCCGVFMEPKTFGNEEK